MTSSVTKHLQIDQMEQALASLGRSVLTNWEKKDAEIERLRSALKDLSRAYVSMMETGRDRIIALGGDCDPVDVMERGDPYLRKAREALSGDPSLLTRPQMG